MSHFPRTLAVAAVAALLIPAVAPAQGVEQNPPAIVPLPSTVLPLKHAPEPTTANITAADLMTRLYIFADDSMQGREAGTIGNFKGTTYIAGELANMGLVPAGDSGTYFQTVPLKERATEPASTLSAGGASLAFGTEWASMATQSASKSDLPVVYGGRLGDSNAMLSPDQMAGKFVVFTLGPNTASLRAMMAGKGGGPAAVGVIAPAMYLAYFSQPAEFVDDPSQLPPAGGPTVLFVSAEGAGKFFDQPIGQLAPGAAGKPASFDVRVDTKPVAYPARNVVGIIPGSDPALKGEYVAVGAHNDHIGFNHTPVDHDSLRFFNHIVRPLGADSRAAQATPEQMAEVNRELAAWRAAHPGTARLDSIDNGADDDGSGTVTALEIAQKIMSLNPHPKRSMLFVWHVGEEKGLLGSTYFTDHPTVPRDSIVAQLNMDMVGRGDAYDLTGTAKDGSYLRGAPNYLMLVGSRRLSTELGNLVEQVNTEDHHGFVFDYAMDADGHPENVYCRSDHYEYARYGIPITFFTTGLHSDYHQVTDEPEYIDYDHMARVGNLVEDVAVHVANLDHRVAVDHPKPDPHGVCKQ
ncbi:MAG TPA: M28 family peptidase [Gemmatimonadaceae bacterium]|nr:M28 family peptidase [Gemmatimonadaceae bacterium]